MPGMSLAENLFLGRWPRKAGVLNYAEMEAQATEAMARLGLDLPPSRLVAGLSPAERQLLEIARVLLGKPKLVILDEPTSSLAAAEAEKVMTAVKRIASEGIAVIYVSHRMNEIRQIAQSATVMRDGRIIDTVDVAGADTREIVRLMLGSEAAQAAVLETKTREKVVLEVRRSLPAAQAFIDFFQAAPGRGSGNCRVARLRSHGAAAVDHGRSQL